MIGPLTVERTCSSGTELHVGRPAATMRQPASNARNKPRCPTRSTHPKWSEAAIVVGWSFSREASDGGPARARRTAPKRGCVPRSGPPTAGGLVPLRSLPGRTHGGPRSARGDPSSRAIAATTSRPRCGRPRSPPSGRPRPLPEETGHDLVEAFVRGRPRLVLHVVDPPERHGPGRSQERRAVHRIDEEQPLGHGVEFVRSQEELDALHPGHPLVGRKTLGTFMLNTSSLYLGHILTNTNQSASIREVRSRRADLRTADLISATSWLAAILERTTPYRYVAISPPPYARR